MSSGFNLNIYNYNLPELENLLSLKSPYTNGDVNQNLCNLRDKLLKDQSKSKQDKKAIQRFLDSVKLRLVKDNYHGSMASGYSNINDTNELMLVPDVSVLNNYTKKEFISTLPNQQVAENLNPIQKRIIKKTVNIDTRFRNNYFATKSTDLYITLPTMIKNTVKMTLTGFELPPNSINTITSANNYFYINGKKIEIDEGTYELDEIIEELNYKNTDTSVRFVKKRKKIQMILFGNDSKVKFNEDTMPLQLKLGWILGFIHGEYSGDETDGGKKILADAAYDGLGSKYLYLAIDDYNNNVNNYFTAAFNSSVLNKNILARISRYSENISLLTTLGEDCASSSRSYFGPINIQKLRIQLLDECGKTVSLNNRDYSFSLEFDCIYN